MRTFWFAIILFLFQLSTSSAQMSFENIDDMQNLIGSGNDPALYDFSNIIGYKYNLFAVQAHKSTEEGTCKIKDGIYLDPRKEYKSTLDNQEKWIDDALELEDNEILLIPGNHKSTRFIKKGRIQDYYIAFKMGRTYTHHLFEEILASSDLNNGEEVNCKDCNFKKVIFDYENNCRFSVFYTIKPIFEDEDKARQQKQFLDLAETSYPISSISEEGEEENDVTEKMIEKQSPIGKSSSEKLSSVAQPRTIKKNTAPKPVETRPSLNASPSQLNKPKVREVKNKKVRSIAYIPKKKETKNEVKEFLSKSNQLNSSTYHVLLGISKNTSEFESIQGLGSIMKDVNTAGKIRYLLGNCSNISDARKLANKVKQQGQTTVLIAKYDKGEFQEYIY